MFLFFLAFFEVTAEYQSELQLRSPILVGFFLAGLVIHGGLQQWWIAPVLSRLGEMPLLLGAIGLTAFNDNAAITYLSTLVPNLAVAMKFAVVAGAITGGGLTVIANAPNPAGQSILKQFFPDGISPLGLLLGALPATLGFTVCFLVIGMHRRTTPGTSSEFSGQWSGFCAAQPEHRGHGFELWRSGFSLWGYLLVLRRVGLQRRNFFFVKIDSGQGAQAVGKNAEPHRHHHGEPDGGLAGQMRLLLQINQSKHDGRQPARAEPPMNSTVARLRRVPISAIATGSIRTTVRLRMA